jgi:hypothetical protein
VGNTDTRQAVFFRGRTEVPLQNKQSRRIGFFAQMIDHGFAFNGPYWEFQDTPLNGLYFRTSVYKEVTSLDSFQPWIDVIRAFPFEKVHAACKALPREWLADDHNSLQNLLEGLMSRASKVGRLIEQTRSEHPKAFPNWR